MSPAAATGTLTFYDGSTVLETGTFGGGAVTVNISALHHQVKQFGQRWIDVGTGSSFLNRVLQREFQIQPEHFCSRHPNRK